MKLLKEQKLTQKLATCDVQKLIQQQNEELMGQSKSKFKDRSVSQYPSKLNSKSFAVGLSAASPEVSMSKSLKT